MRWLHGGGPMRITHNKVGQNLNVRENIKDGGKADQKSDVSATDKVGSLKNSLSELGGPNDSAATEGATRVQLSERAQQMKRAKEIATNAPDINEARVAELQKLIDEGKYKTDARAIADKMVDEQLAWE